MRLCTWCRNIFNVLDWFALVLVIVWASLMCHVTMFEVSNRRGKNCVLHGCLHTSHDGLSALPMSRWPCALYAILHLLEHVQPLPLEGGMLMTHVLHADLGGAAMQSKKTADLVARPVLNMTLTELALLDEPNAG
jgi:hypothetical protein